MNLPEYQRRVMQTGGRVAGGHAGVAEGVCELTATVGALASTVARGQGRPQRDVLQRELGDLMWRVAALAAAAGLDLGDVAAGGLAAVEDLYGTGTDESRWAALPVFDAGFPDGERFPRRLIVAFRQHVDPSGRRVVTATGCSAKPGEVPTDRCVAGQPACHPVGTQLGDPLTDNARTPDGYRFHDAIHLGFLAVLGWSPNLRALLRVKRKSDPAVDECEDGARAIFAEEGLAAVLARLAQIHDGFRTPQAVTRDAVEVAWAATVGLEAHAVPGWLWRHAIWQGFRAMHQLVAHDGGQLVADLDNRTLTYRPPCACLQASASPVPATPCAAA
jgi:NTP pyrophosphatase (non-canonical NTP hydrolase)